MHISFLSILMEAPLAAYLEFAKHPIQLNRLIGCFAATALTLNLEVKFGKAILIEVLLATAEFDHIISHENQTKRHFCNHICARSSGFLAYLENASEINAF